MIYIIANSRATSGGPELLHQLCYMLKKNKFNSSMIYFSRYKFGTRKVSDALKDRYGKYCCNVATSILDVPENTVVIPETMTFFLPKIKKAKKVIWWQSVDNYFISLKSNYAKLYAPFGMNKEKYNPFEDKIFHCYQSEYARCFLCENGVSENHMFSLSDFINDDVISNTVNESECKKEDVILYNPRKGVEYTEQIMKKLPEIKFIPLKDFSTQELSEIMTRSKLYIDFGNHPGKDRIPREAVLGGCCVIVGKRGSAINDIDVPILDRYKFGVENLDLDSIVERIYECIYNYDNTRLDFDLYREKIKKEKALFERETIEFGEKFC